MLLAPVVNRYNLGYDSFDNDFPDTHPWLSVVSEISYSAR